GTRDRTCAPQRVTKYTVFQHARPGAAYSTSTSPRAIAAEAESRGTTDRPTPATTKSMTSSSSVKRARLRIWRGWEPKLVSNQRPNTYSHSSYETKGTRATESASSSGAIPTSAASPGAAISTSSSSYAGTYASPLLTRRL